MAKIVCNVISYVLKRTVDITVIVPTPSFPQAMRRSKTEKPVTHTPEAKYPVLYLLHGGGNNHATWTGYTNVELFAEERQIAVVSISGENKSFINDGRDDFLSFISEELPDFVCGMFPVSERPEDTYIAGLSMGGYGTLVHALLRPERYMAFGILSAMVRMLPLGGDFDPDTLSDVFDKAQKEKLVLDPGMDPELLAEKIAASGSVFPKAYVTCGDKDAAFRSNLAFSKKLAGLGADVTWEPVPGYAHEWRFWNMAIERFLDWLPRTDCYAAQGKRRI